MTNSEPTFRQLRALIALAETGTFRRAAERLGITQPSLSGQIATLETALGVVVVERGRSGAVLTPVGREILHRARRIGEAMTELTDFASGPGAELGGAVRFGVSPTIGPYLLPSVVARLAREMPELRLLIREGPPERLSRELADGGHDTALLQLPLRESALAVETVLREPLHLVLRADHPLAAREKVVPEDLAGLEVLTLDREFRLHEQVSDFCEVFGARMLSGYEGTSLDALRLMVGMGLGVTFLPDLYVRSEIRPGDAVVARGISGRSITRAIGLAWRRSAPASAPYRRLAMLIGEAAQELRAREPSQRP